MSASVRRQQPLAQGGGLFSTHKASFSKETKDLLKVMMQESKLTSFQQRQLKETMQSGKPLPLRCHPTSSSSDTAGTATRKKKTQKPKSHGTGLRSKDTIDKVTDTELDYRPAPSKYNSAEEKQRLQNVMAFGTDTEPQPQPTVHQDPSEANEKDRFDEVLEEIEERREFLTEMEGLGQGEKYRNKIMTEISQRVRELEELDKERCSEFTAVLQEPQS